MYQIKKCRICNKHVHVHKKHHHFVVKDCCEHIDSEKSYSQHEIDKITMR